MGSSEGGASSSSASDAPSFTFCQPSTSSPAPTDSMRGLGPALGTPPTGCGLPPATVGDLPLDVLRSILALLDPTPQKRALSRVCHAWRHVLSSPAAWPAVDLHPVTVASCTWLSRVLAGPGGGKTGVTVRAPSDEHTLIAFHDLVLATAPPALASLSVTLPWQTSCPFSHLWWSLKHQRGMHSLFLRGGSVDVAALPLGAGSALAHLAIECTSLDNLPHLSSGARHLTALDLSVWPALGGPASAAVAAAGRRPGPGGRAVVERAGGAVAGGGLDVAPLAGLTSLRSLALNTHPWSPASAEALWSFGLAALGRLTSLTLAAAPGFGGHLSLPEGCSLSLSARGALPPRTPTYASLASLSLRDLASPTFDASALAPCRQLAALDVSFAAETGCVTGLARLTRLTSLKAGCSALRIVLPPLPALRELECVAFGDLEISFDRGSDGVGGPPPPSPADTAARALASAAGSVYLASLNFDVGVMQFVHACGRAGLDLHFAHSPLRAVYTADQVEGG